jgi:Tfp pilus assembly protein PilF
MKNLLFAAALYLVTMSFGLAQDTPENPNVLPMFGKTARTEIQQKQDQKFLRSSDANFSTRKEASNFFIERGWEYLNEGQTDTAMYRFNLAWLLNPDNKDTYWAFGLITAGKGNPKEAIGYYEKAMSLSPKNSMLLSDLAASYVMLYEQKKKKKLLKQATAYLTQAISSDTQNAYAYYTLSQVNYHGSNYKQAWENLHKGRVINMAMLDYTYLLKLTDKMPDPQGFFKNSDTTAEAN